MSGEATAFFKQLVNDLSQGYGIGSMSCSVYDTAWVSCVSKQSDDGQRQWLFPSSFKYILDCQQADGGWQRPLSSTFESVEDAALSSLAAIFAITQHVNHPLQLFRTHVDVGDCLRRGVEYVTAELRRLGRGSVYSVGFEMLVPA